MAHEYSKCNKKAQVKKLNLMMDMHGYIQFLTYLRICSMSYSIVDL